jgi:L-2,4-diaminobutyrate decarboxylase
MDHQSDWQTAVEALSSFLDASARGEGRVITQPPIGELAARLDAEGLIARGGLTGERFRAFLHDYLGATTRLHHPGYLAHQVAPAHPLGAAGALIDAATNNAMAIYEMGPAAATLEFVVLRWMLGKVGWSAPPLPPGRPQPGVHAAGVLTHGGSLANLTALLAARGRVAADAFRAGVPQDLVLIAPQAAHYSIARAAGVLGLGGANVVPAPSDADGRLVPDGLPALVRTLADRGKRVLAVVANACSTAAGLYDPLREVGRFCREQGLWLHVDGAHGASALLSARLRPRLDGVELADSLVWDAHKMLRTPTLCAAVLVRDGRDLDRAFQQEASYLLHEKDEPGFDFMSRTVECTKAGLGLRLFLTLAAEGEGAIAAYVERQYALALEVAARLRREPGVEVAVTPESNIVCFRYQGADARQLELRRRVLEQGRYYLSSAELAGRRWLRLALMSATTELETVEAMLGELRQLAAEVR